MLADEAAGDCTEGNAEKRHATVRNLHAPLNTKHVHSVLSSEYDPDRERLVGKPRGSKHK